MTFNQTSDKVLLVADQTLNVKLFATVPPPPVKLGQPIMQFVALTAKGGRSLGLPDYQRVLEILLDMYQRPYDTAILRVPQEHLNEVCLSLKSMIEWILKPQEVVGFLNSTFSQSQVALSDLNSTTVHDEWSSAKCSNCNRDFDLHAFEDFCEGTFECSAAQVPTTQSIDSSTNQ